MVGLSLGGMTAQSLAARHPERVDKLVLMATAAHLPGNWEERARIVQAEGMAAFAEKRSPEWKHR